MSSLQNIENMFRQMVDYQRSLIEEITDMRNYITQQDSEIAKLEEELNEAKTLIDAYQSGWKSEQKSVKDTFEDMEEITNDFFEQLSQFTGNKKINDTIVAEPVKKEVTKKGTQVLVDSNVGMMFKKKLEEQELSVNAVANAFMYIFTDRSRYRNIILKNIKDKFWESNTTRKTLSFAWIYPLDLGSSFNKALKENGVHQYQAIEVMMDEYIKNPWMQKLAKDYMQKIKIDF